jgi:hypothetical protein
MQVAKESMPEGDQLTLSWKSLLPIFVGALLIGLLFNYLHKSTLERPTGLSIVVVAFAVAMKWELRSRIWFWTAMAIFVSLHVLLILIIPWPTGWIPAIVMIPIGLADLYVMLAILSVVGKFVDGQSPSEN